MVWAHEKEPPSLKLFLATVRNISFRCGHCRESMATKPPKFFPVPFAPADCAGSLRSNVRPRQQVVLVAPGFIGLGGTAPPGHNAIAQSYITGPQPCEPRECRQLWSDDSEQPFHDQETDGIRRHDHPRSSEPMALAGDEQGYEFQRFHNRHGDREQHHRLIRAQSLDSTAHTSNQRHLSSSARAWN